MTVTEPRPASDTQAAPVEAADPYFSEGFAGAMATGDHKLLGKMYVFFGLAGGLLAMVLGLLAGLERTNIGDVDIFTFGSDNQFFQAWSLGRTSLLFFCVVPLLLGLATYVIPLQVGAPSIAFPRAAAAAFWAWVVGMGIHVATVFVDGGLGYPTNPVEAAQGTDPEAIELSLISIALVVLAVLLASVTLMTTVITQRPLGMSLYEVPLFAWSILVAGAVWLLTLPVWLANLAVIWVDFRGEDALRYGNVESMWTQLEWLWAQPAVFAFAIPVLGILGDLVPVAASTRQRAYGVQQVAIGAFGVLTFGAWAQPAFNPEVTQEALFVVMSLLLALPLLAFAGGLVDTLVRGKPSFSGQLVVGLLALGVLLAAAAAAVIRVLGPGLGVVREIDEDWLGDLIDPLEDLRGTVISTGVMQLALGAALIGAIAGLYYWAPKMFGRRLSSGLGALAGLALAGGTIVTGAAHVVNGFLDEGEAVYAPDANAGVWDTSAVEAINGVGVAGIALILGGLGLVLLDLLVSVVAGRGDGDDAGDPWGGHTLEWATVSPPPLGNFEAAPVVRSERPLLDVDEEEL